MDRAALKGIKQIRRDTIVTFDPQTFEEQIKIAEQAPLQMKDLDRIRILQLWYYDEKTKRLYSEIKSLGPAYRVKDHNGNVRYTKGWFYFRY